jgi:hypothetical protein
MYCEDTRPQNRLSAAQEQHEGLCTKKKRKHADSVNTAGMD